MAEGRKQGELVLGVGGGNGVKKGGKGGECMGGGGL